MSLGASILSPSVVVLEDTLSNVTTDFTKSSLTLSSCFKHSPSSLAVAIH